VHAAVPLLLDRPWKATFIYVHLAASTAPPEITAAKRTALSIARITGELPKINRFGNKIFPKC